MEGQDKCWMWVSAYPIPIPPMPKPPMPMPLMPMPPIPIIGFMLSLIISAVKSAQLRNRG